MTGPYTVCYDTVTDATGVTVNWRPWYTLCCNPATPWCDWSDSKLHQLSSWCNWAHRQIVQLMWLHPYTFCVRLMQQSHLLHDCCYWAQIHSVWTCDWCDWSDSCLSCATDVTGPIDSRCQPVTGASHISLHSLLWPRDRLWSQNLNQPVNLRYMYFMGSSNLQQSCLCGPEKKHNCYNLHLSTNNVYQNHFSHHHE